MEACHAAREAKGLQSEGRNVGVSSRVADTRGPGDVAPAHVPPEVDP